MLDYLTYSQRVAESRSGAYAFRYKIAEIVAYQSPDNVEAYLRRRTYRRDQTDQLSQYPAYDLVDHSRNVEDENVIKRQM